jgi:L-lysine 2,3-aminomutase
MSNDITLETHFELAKDMQKAADSLRAVHIKLTNQKPLNKSVLKAWDAFTFLRSELDKDYHSKISEEEFRKYKHIYYQNEPKA